MSQHRTGNEYEKAGMKKKCGADHREAERRRHSKAAEHGG
jgi:hypothetical protein